ncbi:MAG: zinc-binding dehydrogenase [Paenibacillaceae bacterium]|nr:zinc-binding dehydrogenase [Paenibacillaceae bacterium]
MKAKAVVFEDRQRAVFREVEVPEPGPNDVVIDVDFSWISIGTESSYFRGERIAGEVPYREGGPWPFPIVAGYQKTGTVVRVGAAVEGLRVGDRVFATVSKVSRMFAPSGGHVSPAVTAADQVWKLPEGADPLDYAGLVLTQVGFNCGSRPPLAPGERAVVIGDGLVGQWAAQTLRHRGAETVVLGRHDERLRYLPAGIDAVNTRRMTDGVVAAKLADASVSVLVDTVGDMETVERLWPALRHNGHLVSAGFLGERGSIDIQRMRGKELTLHTPSGWTKERMDRTLEGVSAGWLRTGELITHRFPASRAAEAWDLIAGKKEAALGVILAWR